MEVFPSRNNAANVSFAQQFDLFEYDVTEKEMFIDRSLVLEAIPAVNARSGQHLESAGKPVLVNVGGAIQPEININIESRTAKQGDRRIAERRLDILLSWQLRPSVQPANDFPWGHALFRQIYLSESLSSYLRKFSFGIIVLAPKTFNEQAEFVKYFHLDRDRALAPA